MDRSGLQPPVTDFQLGSCFRWPVTTIRRPVAGLRIAQGDVAALPGRASIWPQAVDIDPARLGELGRVSDRPNGRPDGVVAAPGCVGLHGAGVAPDDLVVDRIDGAPDLELRDAVAGVELVHEARQVRARPCRPSGRPTGSIPRWPKGFAGGFGLRRGVAAAFWSICHGSRPST